MLSFPYDAQTSTGRHISKTWQTISRFHSICTVVVCTEEALDSSKNSDTAARKYVFQTLPKCNTSSYSLSTIQWVANLSWTLWTLKPTVAWAAEFLASWYALDSSFLHICFLIIAPIWILDQLRHFSQDYDKMISRRGSRLIPLTCNFIIWLLRTPV